MSVLDGERFRSRILDPPLGIFVPTIHHNALGTPTPSSHHGRTYSTHHADYHDDPAPRHHDAHDVDKDFNLCWRGERDFWLKFPNIPRSVLSWIDFSYLWWRRRTASTIICMMHHLILEPVFEFHKENPSVDCLKHLILLKREMEQFFWVVNSSGTETAKKPFGFFFVVAFFP